MKRRREQPAQDTGLSPVLRAVPHLQRRTQWQHTEKGSSGDARTGLSSCGGRPWASCCSSENLPRLLKQDITTVDPAQDGGRATLCEGQPTRGWEGGGGGGAEVHQQVGTVGHTSLTCREDDCDAHLTQVMASERASFINIFSL